MAIEVPNSLGQPANDINDHRAENNNGNGHVAAQTTGKSKPAIETYINNIPRIRINAQLLPVIGLFVFYIAHDALQERMFRFEGFEFGFFMTLVEVLIMLVGSTISEGGDSTTGVGGMCSSITTTTKNSKRKRKTLSTPVLIRISWVGLFLAIAHGLGNTSLKYSPYPLKVAFKSCKLVPTMAMGACVTGRQFSILQYTAALVMGMGLAVLTAADVFNSKQTVPLANINDSEWHKEIGPFIGPILLTISTVFDSIVPNLQEQLLQTHRVKTSEMILVSNMVMCFVLVLYTIYSGELILAWNYCASHRDASVVLFFQGLCAYFGLQSYLALIRDYGGVIGVLFANARKVLTIILSFLLFAKAFNERHLIGLVLVFIGVYLGYISKKGKKKKDGSKSDGTGSSSPGRKKKRRERLRKSATGDSHEHHV